MSAPVEFPVLEGTKLATNDGDVIRLSDTDVFALYVETAAIITSADGVVTVGRQNPPSMPAGYFPPYSTRIPDLRYAAYYNLKNMYVKATRAGDGCSFSATLPQVQPPAS